MDRGRDAENDGDNDYGNDDGNDDGGGGTSSGSDSSSSDDSSDAGPNDTDADDAAAAPYAPSDAELRLAKPANRVVVQKIVSGVRTAVLAELKDRIDRTGLSVEAIEALGVLAQEHIREFLLPLHQPPSCPG